MVAQVEQRAEDDGTGGAGGQRIDGGTGGTGGQRMVACEEQRWYKGTD